MTLPENPVVAIVGATGAVGVELLDILDRRSFPCRELRLLASPRSAGSTMAFQGRDLPVAVASPESFAGVDVAFFSAGSGISKTLGPAAVAAGCTVIDNSSAFRMDPDVPLIVPEVNGDVLATFEHPGIIANPNCTTIIALMAVTPLHRIAGVTRMVVSTYQAASGAGAAFMAELEQQAKDHVAGQAYATDVIGRQYIFNVFSHDSEVGDDGYNMEERKVLHETRKIWGTDDVAVTATCIRVPVLRAHCEAINLTFERPLEEAEARAALATAPGVTIVDDRAGNRFPEPIDAGGRDDVLVGRIRPDWSQAPGRGLDIFVAGDQLRKGAALNAVQIAEALVGAPCGGRGVQ